MTETTSRPRSQDPAGCTGPAGGGAPAPAAPPGPSHAQGRIRPLLPHLPFAALLLAGAVLRLATWRAYSPALLYPDSRTYLLSAVHHELNHMRPSGYSVFVWPFLHLGGLATITLVQHLIGLAMAAAIYLLLLRLGVRTWLAALAAAPVLLDSMQLVLEQYIMSDVLFEVLLLAACVLLLWRPRPGPRPLLAAGMALGVAGLVRGAGTLLVVPAVVTVVASTLAGGWRRTVRPLLALVLGFALPIGVYATGYKVQHGKLAVTNYASRFMYSRLAPIADCRGLTLPAYERSLCPREPLGQRLTTNQYMWRLRLSPQYHVRQPPGMTVEQVLSDFNRRIMLHQPVDYARLVGRDLLRGFQPFRVIGPRDVPLTPWVFQTRPPSDSVSDPRVYQMYQLFADHPLALDRPLASALTAYQHLGHTPGPLLAACALAALLTALGVGRARRSKLRVAAWTFVALIGVPLVTAAMSSTFSWRYQLPQLVLLPPAGALALTALVGTRSPAAPAGAETTFSANREATRR
jgi:Dolichyl-phosphate-mannose-protein mannosyltransferase